MFAHRYCFDCFDMYTSGCGSQIVPLPGGNRMCALDHMCVRYVPKSSECQKCSLFSKHCFCVLKVNRCRRVSVVRSVAVFAQTLHRLTVRLGDTRSTNIACSPRREGKGHSQRYKMFSLSTRQRSVGSQRPFPQALPGSV